MRKSAAVISARATTRRPRTSLIDAEWDALHLRLVTSPPPLLPVATRRTPPPPLPVVARRSVSSPIQSGLPRPRAKVLRPGTKVPGPRAGKRRTLSFAIVFALVAAAIFGLWAKPTASVHAAVASDAPPSPESVARRAFEPPPPIFVAELTELAELPPSEVQQPTDPPARKVVLAAPVERAPAAAGRARATAASKSRAGTVRNRSGAPKRARREASSDNPY